MPLAALSGARVFITVFGYPMASVATNNHSNDPVSDLVTTAQRYFEQASGHPLTEREKLAFDRSREFLRENPDAPESDATMFALGYITQFIDNNIGKDQELQNVLVKRITKIKKELNDE